MSDTIFTVSQVSAYISKIIDSEYLLKNISISGEVTNASMSGGYIYFNVKDEQNSLPCVCFDKNYAEMLKNGAQVIVVGSVSYYGKSGKLSFIVRKVTLNGEGLLYKKFLELKEKLEKQGLFDQKYKKPIPKFVKRIGVVSSNTGAVIRDIINVTRRRNDTVDIVLYPVKVQGVGAEEQIAQGINFFSDYQNVDVVIVARGGGSFEDLMPFNSEIVATSAFQCKKPLISAVGHETDFTIIDFVSSLRAPTPSAAAELAVFDKKQTLNNYKDLIKKSYLLLDNKRQMRQKSVYQTLKNVTNLIDNQIVVAKTNVFTLLKQANTYLTNILDNNVMSFDALNRLLVSLDPNAVLAKGYAKITINGKVVSSVKDMQVKDKISLHLKDGEVKTVVEEIV